MATKTTQTTIEDEGVKKEALEVVFTNGSLQQLKDLAPFFGVTDPSEVIEKAIGIAQQIKDINEKKSSPQK